MPTAVEAVELWKKHGGQTFGPHVEHVSIPMSGLAGFIKDVATIARRPSPPPSGDVAGALPDQYSATDLLLAKAQAKALMLRLGEPIAFGSDAEVIEELVDALAAASSQAQAITQERELRKAAEGERDEAKLWVSRLTKALTGLTVNGSEFFIRVTALDTYVADIEKCTAYVRDRQERQHQLIITAYEAKRAAEAQLAQLRKDAVEAGAALTWAMDEIDVLANKAVQFAYPQAMRLVGRADQLDAYRKAVDARRIFLNANDQGTNDGR